MASTFAVTRNHLIFGLCLPLAVLMGYVLAEPLESTSLTVLLMIIAGLIVPVLLRWYHPLLIFSWNMSVYLAFLPGSPQLWALMSLLGLGFAVLNRSVNPEYRFAPVPAITLPLLTLMLIVAVTAMLTGGIGLRVLGSESMGGKGYFYLAAAAAGFFALSSQAVPRHRIYLVAALFFLPGVTAIIGRLVQAAGPSASYLLLLFPPESEMNLLGADNSFDLGLTRASGIMVMAMAIFSWVLARHGVTGIFDFSRPWRMAILIGAVILGTLGGFRSAVLLMAMTFLILFWLEKLWGTRIFLIMVMGMTLGGVLLVGFADKLPLTIQRSLSFLPLEIDPLTRISAQDSTEWRLEIWKATLTQVPQYFFKGKGYSVSGDALYMSHESVFRGLAAQWEGAAWRAIIIMDPFPFSSPSAFGVWRLLYGSWLPERVFYTQISGKVRRNCGKLTRFSLPCFWHASCSSVLSSARCTATFITLQAF